MNRLNAHCTHSTRTHTHTAKVHPSGWCSIDHVRHASRWKVKFFLFLCFNFITQFIDLVHALSIGLRDGDGVSRTWAYIDCIWNGIGYEFIGFRKVTAQHLKNCRRASAIDRSISATGINFNPCASVFVCVRCHIVRKSNQFNGKICNRHQINGRTNGSINGHRARSAE